MADNDHHGAEDGESNGKVAGGWRDGERRVGDSDRGCAPGGDGGNTESAGLSVDVNDARVGGGKELEHSRREEHGNDGTETLSEPLVDRRSAQQETSSEVANKIGGLRCSVALLACALGICCEILDKNLPHVTHSTTEEVEPLGPGNIPVLALGCTTENDLRSL